MARSGTPSPLSWPPRILGAGGLLLVALVLARPAAAAPVILLEGKFAQYREAAAAAHRHIPDALEVDLQDADASEKLEKASLVVAVGQRALARAREQTGVPVVFCMVIGAARAALAENVTGVPVEPDPASVFRHIKAVVPAVRRLGLIYNPKSAELWAPEALRAASAHGLSLVTREVPSPAGVKDALDEIAGKIDALWLPADPKLYTKDLFAFLLGFCAERRLPLFGFLESFTEAGALASISPDYADVGERAGKLAAGLLARPPTKRLPGPGPVFAPGNLSVNLNTATVLGIDIPPEAITHAKKTFAEPAGSHP